jgi:hypothetical protein
VISPTIWVVYCQDLLDRLRSLGVGCHLPGGTFGPSASHPAGGILCGDTYVGVTIYADDILLLAPTRSSLQLMVREAEMFASSHNILFSTDPNPSRSKSKCLWFHGKSGQVTYPAPILLNGDALPWVDTATHLGHELHQLCNMDFDAKCKRASYIQKTTTIREMFDFARPEQKLSAIAVYAGGIYGFALWDLFGQRAESAFKCWDTAVKLSWDCVPRSCHRWLVDSLLSSGLPSSRQHHLAMYAGFYRRLHTSSVPEVREMAYYCLADMRSNTARNICRICDELDLQVATVTPEAVRLAWQPRAGLPDDLWKVDSLRDMLEQWLELKSSGVEEEEHGRLLSQYIHTLCEM